MRLQVRFEVEVPDDMPLDAAKEWLAFEVGERNDMISRYHQMDRDIEPLPDTFRVWENRNRAMSDIETIARIICKQRGLDPDVSVWRGPATGPTERHPTWQAFSDDAEEILRWISPNRSLSETQS